MKQIIILLDEIKKFLHKHSQLNQSEALLNKVEQQLHNLQTFVEQSLIQTQKGIQSPTKTYFNPCSVNLVDIFILEYSFLAEKYEILPYKLQNDDKKFHNDRVALLNLIKSHHKYHKHIIQKTQSMTELHKQTSNISTCKPVLIMPNYTSQENDINPQTNKYFYIYQQKICVQYQKQFYLVDRYHIFCTYGLAYNTISLLFRQIRQKIFSDRIMASKISQNVPHQLVYDCLIQTIPEISQSILNCKMKIHKIDVKEAPPVFQITQKEIKFKANIFSVSKLCKLAVILFYTAITDRKIILLVKKQKKHLLTQTILSLEQCITPLKYVFPVIFASLTQQHTQYLESPVPIMMGLWGSDKKINKVISQRQQNRQKMMKFHETDTTISEIFIDLQKLCIPNLLNMETQDIYTLQKLNNYINKYGRGKKIEQKINNFFLEVMLSNQANHNSEWIQILIKKTRKSQIYHAYTHHQ